MTAPPVVAQLSDPHVGAEWEGVDPVPRLAAAVQAVRSLRPRPAAVLVTGDLVEHRADGEYEQAAALLSGAGAPVHVLPGNHDDRATLRRHFGVPGSGADPIGWSVYVGALRVVGLDTTRPGDDPGELDAGRLDWLDAELAAAPGAPTLLAMHHPPLRTGMPAWDAIGFPEADARALAGVLARHPQVRRIAGGHVHRPVVSGFAGRDVVVAPSTYVQGRLELGSECIELAPEEPAGFVLHVLLDGEIVSHVVTVA